MQSKGLYNSQYEHDACGVGFIAHIKGQRSHSIVREGLEVLKNLTHRGAVGADPLQGDGAGILIQIPDKLLRDEMVRLGVQLPPAGEYGVGMIFLPREEASRHACEEEIERAVAAEGQIMLGWREVPVDHELPMSEVVREKEPVIKQIFVGHSPDVLVTDALERKLYLIRKRSSIAIDNLKLKHCKEFYIPSFSARTIVYKGQLLARQVGQYYRDLQDTRCVSAIALIHQRFSTNTFPQWSLAHPFRFIAHNGEINTLRGNFNWIRAREKHISSPVFGDDLKKLWPLIFQGQSDSASFDNVFELLTMSGYSLAQAAMMMIPAAWEKDALLDPKLKAFYEYYAAMMEPWDGPAAVAFTDGRQIGATLDRNGLRPARYLITKDDLVILASEAGVLNIDESRVQRHWRLEPGRMLLIDTEQGRIIDDEELKNSLATARPYPEWIDKVRIRLGDIRQTPEPVRHNLPLRSLTGVFGYTQEEVERLLRSKALSGAEPVVSMGNDTPLAVLSGRPRLLYDYFRQLFAQVTNPPIDPIREAMVTSLISFVGPRPDLLNIMDNNPPVRLEVEQPVLKAAEMEKIRNIAAFTGNKFRSRELDITYPLSWGKNGIEARLASILAAAVDAVKSGVNILIITDRHVSAERLAIPALLATSAVHQCLVQHGLRTSTGLVVETGSARTVHHFALLGGYGAEAVHPYVALEVVASLGKDAHEAAQYTDNYIHAIDKGLYKIMSRMGICTYMSYIGAQIFEAVGLSQEFIDRYFAHTPSPVEGVGLFDIAQEAVTIHEAALHGQATPDSLLPPGGDLNWRFGGEEHMWTPEAVVSLQRAVRENSYADYQKYAAIINDQSRRLMTLRGLFAIRPAAAALKLEEVESEESIIRRFAASAMSMGAISTEAHCTLAVAMNRLGAMSNCGEGGEDPRRAAPLTKNCTLKSVLGEAVVADIKLRKGDSLKSRVKQVASGRFGVTASYLSSADVIQIKIAQGAKPGEGGQLPGHKVSPYIGMLRHSLPGIGLISPPPHHDIYSIEDLAQLIFDLKLANPQADISVKLVSEVGIGTVAAGVAKCKADHIVISGHDGGTGAAPASSMKHAGSAWEIGLSDVQQTLMLNNLRSRVRLQVDGQIKTGRDVVIGALLGADEFGFGTAPLVCMGCLMMRKCQKNTCPAGIATQDPELRTQFAGTPEQVENYFHFVAREVRELMASLGFKRFEDLIGRSDLLEKNAAGYQEKARGLNFERIFFRDENAQGPAHQTIRQEHELDRSLDYKFLPTLQQCLKSGHGTVIESEVVNVNRAVGTLLSGEVARCGQSLEDNFLTLKLHGTAGQSLGAFLMKGLSIALCGQANDYVGKGLSGGIISICKDPRFDGKACENILAGNTCLYGATSGELYLCGVAGERFGVRNSGARAVCEGLGDHGCEYMTGGTVVVLGRIGRNFGAGMSGGVAYLYDPEHKARARLSEEAFIVTELTDAAHADPLTPLHEGRQDEELLHELIAKHQELTASMRARAILEHWNEELPHFLKIIPTEYFNALKALEGR
ncbi:MAG: glutamate synthase large subunit [Succinivibrio sp.]|nr:glutamate synthase large subunit [Succinivibrio sp.]